MISKITAVNIVHNVIAEHFHGEWNEEEQAKVFSAWDKELLTINKEICKRIREEVEDEKPTTRSCDRNICASNEVNGVSCDECEIAKYHNLEDDDSPCQNCGVEE